MVKITDLSDEDLQLVSQELQIEKKASKYAFSQTPTLIQVYDVEDGKMYVPFSYTNEFSRPSREKFRTTELKFSGELRPPQREVRDEILKFLNAKGSIVLSAYTGFGKTAIAINIATKIKLPTLVLCHRVILMNQWKKSIQNFCPNAVVEIVKPGNKLSRADFYIMNASNIPKNPRSFYKNIGFLIVDEIHIVMAERMSRCMQFIVPRYVLGLSATPYRTDGLDSLLDIYFGQEKIIRKLKRKHILYKIETGIKPEVELNKMGKIDWGSVLASQASNERRNEMVVNLVKFFPKRTFLVLCKRVSQARFFLERFRGENVSVTSLIGNEQDFDEESRVLIGISQKTGTGFDHPKLDALILATDYEGYFEQYLGRVFRREDTVPFIFDLVDNHPILAKHFRTRSEKCQELGGTVKNFRIEFPKLKI